MTDDPDQTFFEDVLYFAQDLVKHSPDNAAEDLAQAVIDRSTLTKRIAILKSQLRDLHQAASDLVTRARNEGHDVQYETSDGDEHFTECPSWPLTHLELVLGMIDPPKPPTKD